jgi:hypothetical protein
MSSVGWISRVPRAAQLSMLLTWFASPFVPKSGVPSSAFPIGTPGPAISDLPVGLPTVGLETGSPQIDQGGSVASFPWATSAAGPGTGARSASGGAFPHRFFMVPSRSVTRKAKRPATTSS